MDVDGVGHLDFREWRRMQAWQLRQRGWKQRQIATALGVSEAAVSQWITMARDDGPVALLARSRPGPAAQRKAPVPRARVDPTEVGFKVPDDWWERRHAALA